MDTFLFQNNSFFKERMPSKLKVSLSGEGGKVQSGVGRTYYLQRRKILKQVEYESARRKSNINEKQEIEMRKALHFFMYIYLVLFCRKWKQKVDF